MAGELFKQMAGIDIVHVPYRGPAPATNDLIGGQVSMMFDTVTFAAQNIQSGKLRAIAVTVPQRVVSLPDVPTFAEAGLPGLEVSAWFGLVAGAGTPQPVIDFLNREANRIFSMPSVRDPHVTQGSILPLGTAEQFGKFIAAEYEKWGTVTKRAGIRVD
jgi:tripartite-type tricarboxylate transporter receptor subunit TctC